MKRTCSLRQDDFHFCQNFKPNTPYQVQRELKFWGSVRQSDIRVSLFYLAEVASFHTE